MPIRGVTDKALFVDKRISQKCQEADLDPSRSSVMLTPECSPSNNNANTPYENEETHNDSICSSTSFANLSHSQLLLVAPSPSKKGRPKKRRVVSTHRNSFSPGQKAKSSNRQKKNNHIQGQTIVTDYFPVRRSNRQTKNCLESLNMGLAENVSPIANDLSDYLKIKYQDIESAVLCKTEDGLKVVDFNGKGRGVVATRTFQRGEFIVEYAGDLIGYKTAKDRERVYASNPNFGCYMYYFVFNSKSYCVDATDETDRLGRLVNHSRNGNCRTKLIGIKSRPYLILVASRDIDDGEELLYDYGDRSKESIAAHPWLRN